MYFHVLVTSLPQKKEDSSIYKFNKYNNIFRISQSPCLSIACLNTLFELTSGLSTKPSRKIRRVNLNYCIYIYCKFYSIQIQNIIHFLMRPNKLNTSLWISTEVYIVISLWYIQVDGHWGLCRNSSALI